MVRADSSVARRVAEAGPQCRTISAMARVSRRGFMVLAGAGGLGLVGLRFGLPSLLRPGPPGRLTGGAAAFAERCFEGLDRSRVWDAHVHAIGLGGGGSGCWLNADARSHLHPLQRLRYDVFRAALDLGEEDTADRDYLDRLLALHRLANPQGKLVLMAFDHFVDDSGIEIPERSPMYTPNEYVLRLAREHEELVACASIHPYRRDAVKRLDAVAAAGARAIKWLPNAMGIDPASPRCDPFYRRLAELGLPLVTHGGKEYAVTAVHAQELGNPLRLRRALDAGVRVVVTHCASFGTARDLDRGGRARAFDLWMRLMGEKQYERTLFADISATTAINRSGTLRELLRATEHHDRLVNGSDYPMPALGLLFSPAKLRWAGLVSREERRWCAEIHAANPLLFDFVVKRSLKVEEGGKLYRFPARVFETAWLFS
jgi:mannonate dehydratase